MNLQELQSQLAPNQCLVRADGVISVKTDDKVTARYLVGQDSQLWPINIINSCPPKGQYRVINLYVDAQTNKLVVDFDKVPEP